MKRFEYADDKIGPREIMIAVSAMIMGVGILFLPELIVKETIGSDGWILIIIGGIIFVCVSWCITKMVSLFPGKSFVELTSIIATKPVAIVLTLIYAFLMLLFVTYTLRGLVNVTEKYILYETPIEVTSLTFLLVVIYAVSGSRVGILRLNVMFFPIVVFIAFVVMGFSLSRVDTGNLLPVLQTDFKSYVSGLKAVLISFAGVSILWFYTPYMRHPKEAPKRVAFGVGFVAVMYVFWFLVTIGVFGPTVTANLVYPSVELAKSIEIPGQFFERFESLFFVIWAMGIFNTASMSLDVMVLALTSVFTKVRKQVMIYIVSPFVFFIAMLPKNIIQLGDYGNALSLTAFIYTIAVLVLLFVLMKVRKVR
ncbi:MAG TPA: endospore germination permease [Virgibacillus sp.]|nr:endospore germination permease [Virgibacillus sp.]